MRNWAVAIIFVLLGSFAQAETIQCRSEADSGTKILLSVTRSIVESASWSHDDWGGYQQPFNPNDVVYRGSTATVAGADLEYVLPGDYICGPTVN